MQQDGKPGGRPQAPDLAHQLQNLRVFLSVANERSIARAARHIFKAASAVTRSILDLERALGVQLFERSSRGVLLNAYGQIVLARAERIDAELNLAAAELSRPRGKGTPPSPSAINHFLYNGKKLLLLIHLADTRKISAAAAHLDITQSGASMALSRIEGALGEPLFQRGMQGMVATDAANRLVTRAKRVVAEFRHMVSDLSAVMGDLSGTVVIGTLPLGRTQILPMAIASTIAHHPSIHVTTIDAPFAQLVNGLRTGEIDAILGVPRDDSQRQGLVVETLFTDALRVMVRADHPLALRRHLRMEDLLASQWILPWHDSLSRTLVERCFRDAGFPPPDPAVESADLPVLRQLLLASDMVAVASPRQMMFELRSGLLVELPIDLEAANREVALITREGAMLSPAAQAIRNALRQQASIRPTETPPAAG